MTEYIRETIAKKGNFSIEVSTSMSGNEDRFSVMIVTSNMGSNLNVSIGSIEKAREIARYLFEQLAPEYEIEQGFSMPASKL